MDDSLNDLAEKIAQQMDTLLYKAAKQHAEALVVTHPEKQHRVQEKSDGGFEVTFNKRYQLCDTMTELKGLQKTLQDQGIPHTAYTIPAFMHRIADETHDFKSFKQQLYREHPDLQ